MKDTIDIYSIKANQFVNEYEGVSGEKIHSDWLHLLPTSKSLVLDIGAGSGRDAAWLAEQGHEVIAVEPANGLRKRAKELHPQPSIQWVDDTLPALKEVYKLGFKFNLILLSAVWMHVAPGQRERAFRKIVNLLKLFGFVKPGAELWTKSEEGKLSVREMAELALYCWNELGDAYDEGTYFDYTPFNVKWYGDENYKNRNLVEWSKEDKKDPVYNEVRKRRSASGGGSK